MENKVEEVEKQVKDLNERVSFLESGSGVETKRQMLDILRDIRFELGKEKAEANRILNERDQLTKENQELRTKVDKLEYRIKFLLKGLEAFENV
eukprot:TRINITY_DN46090_c0_g1_i1.p3 TRINITY_DN46090_c0_g1~~TRINITY_DN46090_c0_g1_i1.p3  ORF type:complete len:101 (+),score=11.46 TRINITY_DN46090_c0_g1_i1:23-304(+)